MVISKYSLLGSLELARRVFVYGLLMKYLKKNTLQQLVQQLQIKYFTLIGIDFKIKTIQIGNKSIKLQIWDTAGQERFKVITKTYYKGAHGVLLTFDITNIDSFDQIEHWMKQINENAQLNISKVLVGNKSDKEKERQVKTIDAENLASKYDMKYYETSAKTNYNVYEVFSYLASDLFDKVAKENANIKALREENLRRTVMLNKEDEKVNHETKKSCCK